MLDILQGTAGHGPRRQEQEQRNFQYRLGHGDENHNDDCQARDELDLGKSIELKTLSSQQGAERVIPPLQRLNRALMTTDQIAERGGKKSNDKIATYRGACYRTAVLPGHPILTHC